MARRLRATRSGEALGRCLDLGLAAASFGLVLLALHHFHDRFWWPADEGVYGYVAQRILAGDIVHRDLIDFHADNGNFVNALALLVFGEDLLSLRYPLIAINLVCCGAAWLLLRPLSVWIAAVGVVAVGASTVLPFLDPSFSWHALPYAFLAALLLTRGEPDRAHTLALAGFLVGACFFTRQLNGVLLAMGILSWLILNEPADERASPWPARLVCAVMAAGVAGYAGSRGDPAAFLVFAIWPLGVLWTIARKARIAPRRLAWMAGWLGAGLALATLPHLVYFASHGALGPWFRDVFGTALGVESLKSEEGFSYGLWLVTTGLALSLSSDPAAAVSASIFLLMLVMPAVFGEHVWRTVHRRPAAVSPLAMIAMFWSVAVVHHPNKTYLYFVLPLVLAAFLATRPNRIAAGLALAAAAWLTVFEAGVPVRDDIEDFFAWKRPAVDSPSDMPRASLVVGAQDYRDYRALLDHIAAHAGEGEPLYAFPHQTIVNFMSGRVSPVPHYHTALILDSDRELLDVKARLARVAPLFVVFNVKIDHKKLRILRLVQFVRRHSGPPEMFGPFFLYRFDPEKHP